MQNARLLEYIAHAANCATPGGLLAHARSSTGILANADIYICMNVHPLLGIAMCYSASI